MLDEKQVDRIMEEVESKRKAIKIFCDNTADFFVSNQDLNEPTKIVHSVKRRLKNPERLRKKIGDKLSSGASIRPDNIFDHITDIAGVRVLHLYQAQFPKIHNAIMQRIEDEEWVRYEAPKAYTWDPKSQKFFKDHGLEVKVKPSLYTSIHYVVRSNSTKSAVSCEIQVRTLFEEIWGEIDHLVNYSESSPIAACRDQVGVLARLVGTGSRLADLIWDTYSAEKRNREHPNQRDI